MKKIKAKGLKEVIPTLHSFKKNARYIDGKGQPYKNPSTNSTQFNKLQKRFLI